ADLLDPRRDLGVTGAGHVGEEVVLHLVAEIAARDVEEPAPLDVGRPDELADVPRPAHLVVDLLRGERVGLVGEVAAEDDRVGPYVADDVGRGVRPGGAAERLPSSVEGPLRGRLEPPAPIGAAATPHSPADPLPAAPLGPGEAEPELHGRRGGGAHERPGDVVLDDLGAGLAGDPLQLPSELLLRLL